VSGTLHEDDIMSTKSAAIRKTRINTERLVEYLGVNESVTVSAIVRERLMNSREAGASHLERPGWATVLSDSM
jgi:hypothetical protein